MANIYAASGYWQDIQTAVQQATIGDNVILPSGEFNFVDPDENLPPVSWKEGVNLFGAPTQRTSGLPVPERGPNPNDQVVSWNTTLRMPWEVPTADSEDQPPWFVLNGTEMAGISTRVSDVRFVGYRNINSSSITMYIGWLVEQILNLRFDHCHFQDLGASAVYVGGWMDYYNTRNCCGVIDHCKLDNVYGNPGVMDEYYNRTLGYGIGLRRWACDIWEPLANVLGKYTNYSFYVEDNYFGKWRHGVCSNDGFHQVFRHNQVQNSYGLGDDDGHGSYADDGAPYAVGTRALEAYKNVFLDADDYWVGSDGTFGINHRGGAGMITDNEMSGYSGGLMDLNDDWGNVDPYRPDCAIHNTYIWNNITNGLPVVRYNGSVGSENIDYFFRAPSLAQDGFDYIPYTYPHPLTFAETTNLRLQITSNLTGVPFTLTKI